MEKTIVITGATGSIGSKLRRHFADCGASLRLLCLSAAGDPKVTRADLSVFDDSWPSCFDSADAVIHLAGDPYATASWESVQRNNIDATLNVLRAAEEQGVKRVVFASSNWVMAGHRFDVEQLTPELAPSPVNAYGCGKLLCERAGRQWSARTGLSFIALRIGCCQHIEGNHPGPQIEHGIWGQQMWLSDRDLCHGMERAVLAEDVGFAILNLMSDNPGMRWDLSETRRVIGYQPRDGHRAVVTPDIETHEQMVRLARDVAERFEQLTARW
jgi:NAD+ dependent glucose-6-phosphate dehydrogenase